MKKIKQILLAVCLLVSAQAIGQQVFPDQNFLCTTISETEAEITNVMGGNSIVTIPSTVTYNGVTYNVTRIGFNAFDFVASNMTSLIIPSSVREIRSAFQNCSNLRRLCVNSDFPPNLYYYFNFEKIKLYVPVGAKGYYQYWGNFEQIVEGGFGEYKINYAVSPIDLNWEFADGVFTISGSGNIPQIYGAPWEAYRTSIKTVNIGYGISSIEQYAFSGFSSLISVSIPESVTTIDNILAFLYCISLSAINVNNSNSNYSSINGILYNKSQTTLIKCPQGKTGTITIPESVTTIERDAFYDCKLLSGSLTIPESVTKIGKDAFSNCFGLTGSLIIPNGVTTIENSAFAVCRSLNSISIPSSVTTIEEFAFFLCTGITSVSNFAVTPQTIGGNEFSGLTLSDVTLYVPAISVNLYKNAPIWKKFNIVGIAPEVEVPIAEGISIVPTDSSALLVWLPNASAEGYELKIYSDSEHKNLVCTVNLNAEGKIMGEIIYHAKSQMPETNTTAVNVYNIAAVVENLLSGTTYYYQLETLGTSETKTGDFTTTGDITTTINNVSSSDEPLSDVRYFDMLGRQLSAPVVGTFYIEVGKNAAGKVVSRKRIVYE